MAEIKCAAPNQCVVSRDVEDEPEHWTEAIVSAEPDLPDPEPCISQEDMVTTTRALREELVEAWAQAELNLKRIELQRQVSFMSNDELRVVSLLVSKLMGEGRREYGPLDLSEDERTARDFGRESRDELADALTYALMRELREQG